MCPNTRWTRYFCQITCYGFYIIKLIACDHMSHTTIFANRGTHCWWCRHAIPDDIQPLGIPISFQKDKCSDQVIRARQQRGALMMMDPSDQIEHTKEANINAHKHVKTYNGQQCTIHSMSPDSGSTCSSRISFKVTHLFCSLNCMARELNRDPPHIQSAELVGWMKRLLKSAGQIRSTKIAGALSPKVLRVFAAGGEGQEIEFYRKDFTFCRVDAGPLPFDQIWIPRHPDIYKKIEI